MSFRDEVNSVKKTEAQYKADKEKAELERKLERNKNTFISKCEQHFKNCSPDYFIQGLQNQIKEMASMGKYKNQCIDGFFDLYYMFYVNPVKETKFKGFVKCFSEYSFFDPPKILFDTYETIKAFCDNEGISCRLVISTKVKSDYIKTKTKTIYTDIFDKLKIPSYWLPYEHNGYTSTRFNFLFSYSIKFSMRI